MFFCLPKLVHFKAYKFQNGDLQYTVCIPTMVGRQENFSRRRVVHAFTQTTTNPFIRQHTIVTKNTQSQFTEYRSATCSVVGNSFAIVFRQFYILNKGSIRPQSIL